ncbi:MAG TPA: glycosyltransferase [Puia sp.]|nr:glycosyltransferase [Puia sp.]
MATVVSIVSYPFLPAKVGGQKGVALFNKYFSRYHQLVCVTTKKNDPSAAEGYEVLNILSNSPLRYINPFYFFTIRSVIRKKKATHIILEHPYYGWLGILLKWFLGVRLVVHSHNIEGLRWKTLGKWWWPILWSYEKWTHRMANTNFFIHDADKAYGIRHFGLDPRKCITMTYGIEWNSIPAPAEMERCRQLVRKQFDIPADARILLFNGAFNYSPNQQALRTIIGQINPLLLARKDFSYRIIICGRDIPESASAQASEQILFAGFVDDISLFFKGADLFINPVTEGGGIKTKLVEALGYNLNAVSTVNGAMGVDPALCNGKLIVCGDGDWNAFVEGIVEAVRIKADIPAVYFKHFYWGYSTKKAADAI